MFQVQRFGKETLFKETLSKKGFLGFPSQVLSGRESSFAKAVKTSYQKQIQQELQSLLKGVDQSASDMMQSPTLQALTQYKKSIQGVLQWVLDQSYRIRDVYGRRMDYKIVENIHQNLDQLAQDLLKREVPRIEILSRVDAIRGLLIDLIL